MAVISNPEIVRDIELLLKGVEHDVHHKISLFVQIIVDLSDAGGEYMRVRLIGEDGQILRGDITAHDEA